MATSFPTSLDSYTTKTNNVDTIAAAHINDPQDAIVAIETLLGASSTRRDATWSPALTFTSGSVSNIVYAADHLAYYARFGSLVFITARITVTSFNLTGGPGNLTFSLPLAAANLNSQSSFVVRAQFGFTTNIPATATANNNAATMAFFTYNSAGAAAAVTSAHVASTSPGFSMNVSGFYWHA